MKIIRIWRRSLYGEGVCMSKIVYDCIRTWQHWLVVIVELFHLTCHFVSLRSQNDKQDSEMMAVRTADKLLKVNLPLCFFYCVHWLSNWSHFFTIYPLDQSANSKLCCFKLSFKHILFCKIIECLVAMNCVDLWGLAAGPQRALNYILNTFCDSRY